MNPSTDRTGYIGGSDAAAVLGLSRWYTPLHVWAVKTGQIVEEEKDTLAMTLGIRLEQTVAELFTEKTGKRVHRVNETLTHPQHNFLRANIDRRVVGEKAILECKTASAWKAKEWQGEEIPREYVLQALHYLAVTGAERCYVAVLVGNQDFKIKTVQRDEKVLADLVAREVAFWNGFVVPKVMPTVVMAADTDTLEALYPRAEEGKEIALDDTANALIESLEALRADGKNVEKQIEQQENELRKLLGDAERGTTGRWKVFWSNRTQRRFDSKALREVQPATFDLFSKEVTSRFFSYKPVQNGGNAQ